GDGSLCSANFRRRNFSACRIQSDFASSALSSTQTPSNAEKIQVWLRSDQDAPLTHSPRLCHRMFHHGRNTATLLSFGSVAKLFAKNADVCGACHLPASDRRCLLASSNLVEREP